MMSMDSLKTRLQDVEAQILVEKRHIQRDQLERDKILRLSQDRVLMKRSSDLEVKLSHCDHQTVDLRRVEVAQWREKLALCRRTELSSAQWGATEKAVSLSKQSEAASNVLKSFVREHDRIAEDRQEKLDHDWCNISENQKKILDDLDRLEKEAEQIYTDGKTLSRELITTKQTMIERSEEKNIIQHCLCKGFKKLNDLRSFYESLNSQKLEIRDVLASKHGELEHLKSSIAEAAQDLLDVDQELIQVFKRMSEGAFEKDASLGKVASTQVCHNDLKKASVSIILDDIIDTIFTFKEENEL